MAAMVRFPKAAPGTFHKALKAEVDRYFEENGLSFRANGAFWAKALFLLGLQFALIGVIFTGALAGVSGWLLLGLCALLGFVIAQIGFNVGHDAIHGAVSEKKWVNVVLGWSFDLAGAASSTWAIAHNFVHHTYTNMVGIDHDLEPGPYLHFYKQPKVSWIHRFQRFYAFPLYGLTSLVWVFKKDFVQSFEVDLRSGHRPPLSLFAKVMAGKIVHWTIFLALPLALLPQAWWQILIGYVTVHYVVGFTLAIVFQLAHCVEGPAFPRIGAGETAPLPWAEHQMHTTANFSVKSWWALALTGGLNHQIEHHLFSRICHIHYPALRPIVQRVAAEYGQPYYVHETFPKAVASHYRQLKEFGEPGEPEVLKAPMSPPRLARRAA